MSSNQPDPAALAECLRVLEQARGAAPDDPTWQPIFRAAANLHRDGKRYRRRTRIHAKVEHDRALLGESLRFKNQDPEVPPAERTPTSESTSGPPVAPTGGVAGGVAGEPGLTTGAPDAALPPVDVPLLRVARDCYVCKQEFRQVHPEYHQMCPPCAEENLTHRYARTDLSGRRAVITGGRIKIGFQLAVKLLRDGAEVLVTSRYPADAARRFAAVPDAGQWLDRLHLCRADLLSAADVAGLVEAVEQRFDSLDILINNAAQTVWRPSAYHREVIAAEHEPLTGLAARIERWDVDPFGAAHGMALPAGSAGPAGPNGSTGAAGSVGVPGGVESAPAGSTPAALAPVESTATWLAPDQVTPDPLAPRPIAPGGALAGPGRAPVSWEELFPSGQLDETGQPLDLRHTNSWALRLHQVGPAEWLQVHVINAFVPFLLTARLRPLLLAAPRPDRYVVQVSAMEGNFSRGTKTVRHPHTNMAKASLNMMVRTSAADYAADGIYMSAVDTGWVTDERAHPSKQVQRDIGFRPPLDPIDGAARVYHPIIAGVAGNPLYGVFLKDYRPSPW